MSAICLFLFVLVCSTNHIVTSKMVSGEPDVRDGADTTVSEPSRESLEEAMSALANLTTAQKEAWEQQLKREESIKAKNKEEELREASRSETLQEEYRLLKEIRQKISRKLRDKRRSSSSKNGRAPPELTITENRPKDCADIYLEGSETSGIYRVWPTWNKEGRGFLVYCDMETEGGGWTVVHRWGDIFLPAAYFKRTWQEYAEGFGDLDHSFWLGNENIHSLTRQGTSELRFDFSVSSEEKRVALHKNFWIEDQSANYRLHVESNGDSPLVLDATPFSTVDKNSLPLVTSSSCSRGWGNPCEKRRDCCNENPHRPAWWYSSDCLLDLDLEIKTSALKMEMKIRPMSFPEMKEGGD